MVSPRIQVVSATWSASLIRLEATSFPRSTKTFAAPSTARVSWGVIAIWFLIAGLLLVVVAGALSLWWFVGLP